MRVIRTSDTDPIRVDFLPEPALGLRGRVGLTFAPGKNVHGMAGIWRRNLAADLARLRETYGAKVLVSLVEDHELVSLGIASLVDQAEKQGIRVLRHPIVDGGVPESKPAVHALLDEVLDRAARGESVVVHCRGGLGRAGLVAACCLVARSVSPSVAIQVVRTTRNGAIETKRQEDFVHGLEHRWRPR